MQDRTQFAAESSDKLHAVTWNPLHPLRIKIATRKPFACLDANITARWLSKESLRGNECEQDRTQFLRFSQILVPQVVGDYAAELLGSFQDFFTHVRVRTKTMELPCKKSVWEFTRRLIHDAVPLAGNCLPTPRDSSPAGISEESAATSRSFAKQERHVKALSTRFCTESKHIIFESLGPHKRRGKNARLI